MAKQPKLTKKMINNLDRAEVRTILMVSMGVKPETAYQQNEKWCIDHIYNNQEEFAMADIQSIGEDRFRKGVFSYVNKMQAYLLGKSEAPSWPPEIGSYNIKIVDESSEEADPQELLLMGDNVNLDLSVNAKAEEADEPVEEISTRGKAVEAPLNTGASLPNKVSFRKVSGLMKADSSENEAPTDNQIDYDFFDESFVEVSDKVEHVINQVNGLGERFASVENALLFIINSAILPEDQMITSLDQIPSPPYE